MFRILVIPRHGPLDDICYVSDTSDSKAWFASVRNSVNNKITVYQVGIIKRPEGSNDLAAIYAKNQALSEEDMRIIKEKARLEVNISEEEYEEIPLLLNDPIAVSKGIHQENIANLDQEIVAKEKEQVIIDSAKNIVVAYEENRASFDSVRQIALSTSETKSLSARRFQSEAKDALLNAQKSNDQLEIQKQIDLANKAMGQAARLNYEATQLDVFADKAKAQIDELNRVFAQVNEQYGNAEVAVISGNSLKAKQIISQMHQLSANVPQLPEIQKEFDVQTASLVEISYPEDLKNPDNYVAFTVSNNQYGQTVIVATTTEYDDFIPQTKDIENEELKTIMAFQDDYTEILSQIRVENKQNGFAIQKVEYRIGQIDKQAQQAFLQAKEMVQQTEIANPNDKESLLAQANEQFDIAYQKVQEQKKLKKVLNDMKMADSTSNAIVEQLNNEKEKWPAYIQAKDVSQAQQLLSSAEKTLQNHHVITDFSGEINRQSGDLIASSKEEIIPLNAYALSPQGEVVKLVGQEDVSWDSYQDFEQDTQQKNQTQHFVVTPELITEIPNKAIISVFEPKILAQGKTLVLLPTDVSAYEDSGELSQEILSQLQSIEASERVLINKRNRVYNYYQQKVKISDSLEILAQKEFHSPSVSRQQLNAANKWSQQSKKILWKASVAAAIIKQYDERILMHNQLIEEAQSQLVNVAQAQNKNSAELVLAQEGLSKSVTQLKEQEVDDSNFNFAVNEVFVATPEVLEQEKNDAYIIANGQIIRNPQTELSQLFELYTPDISPDISQAKSVVSTQEYNKIKEERAQIKLQQLQEQQQQQLLEEEQALAAQANNNLKQKLEADTISVEQENNTNLVIASPEVLISTEANVKDTIRQTAPTMLAQEEQALATQANNNLKQELEADTTSVEQEKNTNLVIASSEVQLPTEVNVEDTIEQTAPTMLVQEEVEMTEQEVAEKNQTSLNIAVGNGEFIANYQPESFATKEDFRVSLARINTFSQTYLTELVAKKDVLVYLAEKELQKSNEWSLQAAQDVDSKEKIKYADSSQKYLQHAKAIQLLALQYEEILKIEKEKQRKITNATIEIESALSSNDLDKAVNVFDQMQQEALPFGTAPIVLVEELMLQNTRDLQGIDTSIDSSYNLSQQLSNESVKLLSEAAEERSIAQGKRNAFKRREQLKLVEEKELQATQLQNKSDEALQNGNDLYARKQSLLSLQLISAQVISNLEEIDQAVIVNQEAVFAQIEHKEDDLIINEQTNQEITERAATEQEDSSESIAALISPKGLTAHDYQRELFKSQLIDEELEALRQEIKILQALDQKSLSIEEQKNIQLQLLQLQKEEEIRAYESVAAFNMLSSIFDSLPEEEQQKAEDDKTDFSEYLAQSKNDIEAQLSQAASLKKQAERANNPNKRVELYDQAQEKEKVAMYYILKEFEIIAQKNRTQYQTNKVNLQQLFLNLTQEQEKDWMRNIFAQIDDYYAQATSKRQKANNKDLSLKMQKMLLQDAYSLELKALALQQQALEMMQKQDSKKMLAFQKEEFNKPQAVVAVEDDNQQTEAIADNTTDNNRIPSVETQNREEALSFEKSKLPLVYKVQFAAIRATKEPSYFTPVQEITAERVPNSTFIRYFSGEFQELNRAIARRNNLRNTGYPDAFIRSWRNGENISPALAQSSEATASAVSQNAQNIASIAPRSIQNIDFSATDISNLTGTYYTVQVGVYSRPRTSAMIYGITPLYHQRNNSNGFWIYYSGIFKSIAQANTKRDEIRSKGVSDAFVVAFTNGNSINLAAARINISQGAATPSNEDIVILEDASLQIDSDWNMAQATPSQVSDQLSLQYKIQIGVYSNRVNLSWVSSQLEEQIDIEITQNARGKFVYSLGSFSSNKEARALLAIIKEIVPDAFIAKYQGDNRL